MEALTADDELPGRRYNNKSPMAGATSNAVQHEQVPNDLCPALRLPSFVIYLNWSSFGES